MPELKEKEDPCVVLLPLTLKDVTLLTLQAPGFCWSGIIQRAEAVKQNYLHSKRIAEQGVEP